MQPQTQPSVPFKGDAGSVANSIEEYLTAETLYYFEYLQKLKHLSFDVTYYLHWRFIENKVNSHRFFLPLVDAVIVDLYINQNLQVSSEQGFNIGLENYISFKDSVRQSLNMLDPYLISCSYTQTLPSYQGYCQWAIFQQQQEARLEQVKKFKQEIAGLNTIVFREDVLATYAFDPNNQGPLTVKGYQNYYDQFVSQEQTQQNTYDIYIQELRKSIQDLNLFVFNDYVDNIETVGEQPTKQGYIMYYDEVLKKYDEEYLKTKHDETIETERTKKERNEKLLSNKKEKAADMDEDQQELADELDEVEEQGYTSNEIQQVAQDVEEITQKDVELKLSQSKECKCCQGNVYECSGEVCQMLGNCICLSQ